MKKLYRPLFVIAAAFLLANCVNVEMETVVNKDRSGEGKLVYSWKPDQNVDSIDIDETFATLERNPTVKVTGRREYDSDGLHHREITWTFEDINLVNLEGMTYSYTKEDGNLVLRAIFEETPEEVVEEVAEETAEGGTLADSVQANNAAALDEMLFGEAPAGTSSAAQTGTNTNIPSPEVSAAPAGSPLVGQGLTPQEQMEMDAETQRQMEEMLDVMIRAALDGYSVKFRFKLPHDILEAPGAEVEGMTATWEIPLKELVDPGREGALDEFLIVTKPE